MNEELREFFRRYQQTYPAPASLNHYLKAAQARKTSATDNEAEIIRILEQNIEEAKLGIEKGDIDLFAQAFERVIRRAVELNLPEMEATARSDYAAKGGDAKAANSPTLPAKRRVYENWRDWVSGKRVTYTGKTGIEVDYKDKADFARQNCRMEEDLKSEQVIRGWCRSWLKGEDIPPEE